MGEHSDYGGSVAEKWLNCYGYYDAVKDLPPAAPTIHTVSGTAQHALNERVTQTGEDPASYIGKPWLGEIPPEFKKHTYDEGNAERARVWVDAILEHCNPLLDTVRFEEKVVLSSIAPELFGTVDFLAFNLEERRLLIGDYKDGGGHLVDVTTTPQLPYYGVGIDDTFGLEIDMSWTIKRLIVQPKAPEPVTWLETTGLDILEWRTLFRHAHRRSKQTPVRIAGEHCHWCRAAGSCDALAAQRRLSIAKDFNGPAVPGAMDDATIAKVVLLRPLIESWLEEVADEGFRRALAGAKLPNLKVVEGRAGARKWADESEAEKRLRQHLGIDAAFERKLISPAVAEKKLGKAEYHLVSDLIVQEAGKPKLVHDCSPKELFDKQKQARVDFAS